MEKTAEIASLIPYEKGSTIRVALWDNVKFLMITLMVVGHFADAFSDTSNACKSIYLFIYAFHMPLFIFISGLFYRNKDNRRKVVFYASCGFALKFVLFLVDLITNKPVSFVLLQDGGIPWFMFSLAAFHVLMALCRNIDKIYALVFSVLLACFTGYDKSIGGVVS